MSKFTVVDDLNTCYIYGAYKYTSGTQNLPYTANTNGFAGHGNILVLSSEYQKFITQNMWSVQILYDNWGKIYKRIYDWYSWSDWTQIYPDNFNKNLATNGYISFTNRLILQYGRNSCINGITTITYSISFTTEPTKLASPDGNANLGLIGTVNSGGTSQFDVVLKDFGSLPTGTCVNWFAIGY